MPDFRYEALGPLPSPGASRAYLGLAIQGEARAEPVVLVWVPEEIARDIEKSDRIRRETERAALLEHPHIVRVYGFSRLEEGLARVVEFADGETLRRILSSVGPLPAPLASQFMADAAQGVHYAHLAGNDDGTPLLHGDIRPDTLLVTFSGHCKISGYGAAAFAPKENRARNLRLAPEQVLGGRAAMNVQTDVYLLGATLFELLTGKAPFEEEADFEQAVLQKEWDPAAHPEVPEALRPVLQQALAKRAADRFASALLLREAIEQAVQPLPSHPELAAWLQERFPDKEGARADRQRMIDAAIASFARRQWEKQEAAGSAAAAPPAPAPSPSPAPAPAAVPQAPSGVGGVQAGQAAGDPSEAKAGIHLPTELEDEEGEPSRVKRPGIAALMLAVVALLAAGLVYYLMRAEEQAGSYPPALTLREEAPADAGAGGLPDGGAVAQLQDVGVIAATGPDAGVGGEDRPAFSGTLALTVEPRVAVEVDGVSVGRAPVRIALEPGRHRLRMHDRGKGIDVTRVVNVNAEGVTSQEIYLQKGFVSITAPPGAIIELDGKRVGKAPLKGELSVYEGAHRIEVTAGKSKWRESFTVKPNQRVYFDVGPQYE